MHLELIVRRKPGLVKHKGLISTPYGTFGCRLGKSGITTNKREGDGATPSGSFEILCGYFRNDRIRRPKTTLPMDEIDLNDGWCDEPAHPAYNRPVRLPFSASHEKMFRDDRLYNVCLVLDYNVSERMRGRGSAIFFHLTSVKRGPTQGCVAVEPDLMLRLLEQIGPGSRMTVLAS